MISSSLKPYVKTQSGANIKRTVEYVNRLCIKVLATFFLLRAFENRAGTRGIPSNVPPDRESMLTKFGKNGAHMGKVW